MPERNLDSPCGAVKILFAVERREPLCADGRHHAEHAEQALQRDDEQHDEQHDERAVRDPEARAETHDA